MRDLDFREFISRRRRDFLTQLPHEDLVGTEAFVVPLVAGRDGALDCFRFGRRDEGREIPVRPAARALAPQAKLIPQFIRPFFLISRMTADSKLNLRISARNAAASSRSVPS
jgi:hypothetical protein